MANEGSDVIDFTTVAKESVHAAVPSEFSNLQANNSSLRNASLKSGSDEEEKVGGKAFSSSRNEDEDEEDSTSNLFRMNSGLLPFPEKLMSLLDGKCDTVADAMWWLPDGDAFCLIPTLFAERVLDKHFQGTKFDSWTRKLNRWYVFL